MTGGVLFFDAWDWIINFLGPEVYGSSFALTVTISPYVPIDMNDLPRRAPALLQPAREGDFAARVRGLFLLDNADVCAYWLTSGLTDSETGLTDGHMYTMYEVHIMGELPKHAARLTDAAYWALLLGIELKERL